jgi:hypothetical protein
MRTVLTMAAIGVAAAVTGLPVAVAEPMTVSPPEVAPGDQGVVLIDDPAILKPHPVHVSGWSRSANPNAVAVHFMSGAPECYGVHVTAKETGQAVTVNVDGGTRSTAVTKMCAMFAQASTVDVPLQAPLGDRRVLATY